MIDGSLEVKLPTIWTDEKQSREEAERREIRRKKRRERVRRKKMQMREMVGKLRNTCVLPMIWGSGGSKSRLARAAGAEPAGQRRDEKLHAFVARSTFASQNVQSTPLSDRFWKLRCRKSARRCGAKHISKSKCTKLTILGPLLEVAMSKKCTPLWREAHFDVKMHKTLQRRTTFGSCIKKGTPLWREAHFEVKMFKTLGVRTTFGSSDVEKVHAVVARSTFRSQNVQNTRGSDHFWKFRCRKSARRCGAKMLKAPGVRTIFGGSDVASLRFTTLHYITLHYTPLHYITLHYTPQHYNYTTT